MLSGGPVNGGHVLLSWLLYLFLKPEEPVVKVMRAKQVPVAVSLRALKLLPELLCLLMSVALRIMGQLLATVSQAS